MTNGCLSPQNCLNDVSKDASDDIINSGQITDVTSAVQTTVTRHSTKRIKSYHHNQSKQQQHQKQKVNQLASPPQDQVSSTQDQVVVPTQDDHDCQTSPPMLTTTHIDDQLTVSVDTNSLKLSDEETSPSIKNEEQQTEYITAQTTTTSTATTTSIQQSSPLVKCDASSSSKVMTTTSTTTSTSSSPRQVLDQFDQGATEKATITSDISYRGASRNSQIDSISTNLTTNNTTTDKKQSSYRKRSRTQHSLNVDQSSSQAASWSSASYGTMTPPSPSSSTTSTSSSCSDASTNSTSSSFCSSSTCSTCSSSPRHSPSPSPLSSPDINNELEAPRLKLNEEQIRKIKKRPVLFEDLYYFSEQQSVASTPTTSSGCSPGQHSTATQNSEQSTGSNNSYSNGSSNSCRSIGLSSTDNVNHMFQAPPSFVNSLKPCKFPLKSQEPAAPSSQSTVKVELISCAICGIRDKPPNIIQIYEQNSCVLCTEFFAKFLDRPTQLYCAQDGDCLMTFDSRCKACWIKICLQKFDIDVKHRKIGEEFSPKLLSSPNVSLITIDTSVKT